MLVDVSTIKQQIKPKADSTLMNMKKANLIQYVRTLEHNYNVAVSFNEQQAINFEILFVGEKQKFVAEVAEQLEAEIYSSDKYIREYEDTEVQRAYNKGLRDALKVVKEAGENGSK